MNTRAVPAAISAVAVVLVLFQAVAEVSFNLAMAGFGGTWFQMLPFSPTIAIGDVLQRGLAGRGASVAVAVLATVVLVGAVVVLLFRRPPVSRLQAFFSAWSGCALAVTLALAVAMPLSPYVVPEGASIIYVAQLLTRALWTGVVLGAVLAVVVMLIVRTRPDGRSSVAMPPVPPTPTGFNTGYSTSPAPGGFTN